MDGTKDMFLSWTVNQLYRKMQDFCAALRDCGLEWRPCRHVTVTVFVLKYHPTRLFSLSWLGYYYTLTTDIPGFVIFSLNLGQEALNARKTCCLRFALVRTFPRIELKGKLMSMKQLTALTIA